jgi:SAM-dependent methyltransferase
MQNKQDHKKIWEGAYADGFFIIRNTPSLVCQELSYYMDLPGKVLDVGSGSGRNTMFFARMGYEVDAVDLVDVFPKASREHGLVKFYNKSIDELDLKEDYYLAIVATRFIHHLSHKTVQELMEKWYRAIRPGGYLALSFAFFADPFKKANLPFTRHKPEKILQLGQNLGFSILIKKDINKVPTGINRSRKKLGDSFEVIFVKK